MHELGIAQEMLNVALDFAKQNNAKQITLFSIEISDGGHESEDALRQHLESLARGTIAEGARLEFTHVPQHFQCMHCGNEFTPSYFGEACPQCGSARVLPEMHSELRLTSIDIE